MSQEKVDQNKEAKRNRKKTVKKRKISHVVRIVCACLVAGVLIGWIAFSIHKKQVEYAEENPTYFQVDTSGITDFMSTLYE